MRSLLYTCVISFVITASSCKKYLDVNTNPNQPTKPTINGLLTRTTLNSALNVYRVSTNITSYYVQYLASPNTASPLDTYDDVDVSTTWTNLYDNMTDIYDLEKLAAEKGATQYQGVAKILMAMNLQFMNSLWGDAPYSSAFSGTTLTPGYDNAQTIFQTCIKLLDDGIALLGQSGSTITIPTAAGNNPDLVHKGVTAAWVRTAHALKARLLNQLSKTNQYNTAAIFTELGVAYTSNTQDAFITSFDVRNPWNQAALNNKNLLLDGWLSEQFIDAMNGKTYGIFDPRLPLLTDTTKYGDYRGTPNGKGRTGTGVSFEETYINLTGYYSSTNSPLFFITYEELKFIEAEAAFRANDRTRAYNAYIEGITANMNKMGVTAVKRDAYITHSSVSVGSANLTLDLIFKEKYKALFLNPETWNDARRYNYQYKDFTLPLNVVASSFVRRMVYPSIETSRNGANVPTGVTEVTQRLWWDQ
ncbi:SusD/RagB family nutrient-binding outer membrane lipoprotein [Niastella caeni]|uniref:SusD/RagB family nutrient-binding outer membrane lipoprotein n=1 Tax=Niastella caeni TaxID=2569763 RepID=A0A4S8I1S9_9BACT|nr:SusD/RagB family nutrient-binding outer membrane lipoprotein [Niastella caeni]THU41671.1 SusD/RagB family nutrient-binding outer membrane lipoprotein [Niastella caeni]